MSYLPPRHIRPIAICVVKRGDSVFVFEGYDSVKNQTFYRPLGGAIEFGELGSDTVAREIREEIGADLVNLRYVAALENIFVLEGHPGHEIVLVYEGDFSDQTLYEIPEVLGVEDGGVSFKARWKPISDFTSGQDPLYPDGLVELLSYGP